MQWSNIWTQSCDISECSACTRSQMLKEKRMDPFFQRAKTRGKLDRVDFRKDFWEREQGQRSALRRGRQRERLKHNRFYEQNNNSARESRFFVHFFAVPAQLRREMNKFWVDLRTGTARRRTLPSLCEFGRGPLSSVPSQLRFFQGTGWLGIRAKKFRRTKRLFSSDVFIGIAVVGS